MKIAVPTKDYREVAGHAGRSRHWLVFDCEPGGPAPDPVRTELAPEQVLHHFRDDGPHPLDGVELIIAASAGEGFVRHMQKRKARVLLTSESDPLQALEKILAGEALPDARTGLATTLCKVKDLFSRY